MSEYREPEEDIAQAAQERRVQAVLDEAVRHGAMLKAAIMLREPTEVVERWIDMFWNGLRENLSDQRPDFGTKRMRIEDRLTAISLLLTDQIDRSVAEILRSTDAPEVAP